MTFLPCNITTLSTVAQTPKLPNSLLDKDCNIIPIISLASSNINVIEEIKKVLARYGAFQVTDHGVDPELLKKMKSYATEFFNSPIEDKNKYRVDGNRRGGFTTGGNLEGAKDLRELLTIYTLPAEQRDYTKWPRIPEGLSAAIEKFSVEMMKLANKLSGYISESLGLESGALGEVCLDHSVQKLLFNYYQKGLHPEDCLGLKRHTDLGIFTLLLQDQVSGLQVTIDDGATWIAIPPIEGAFVFIVGDSLHLLSNGRFKNADHRVVVNETCHRLSIATFLDPLKDAILYPLVLSEGEKPILERPINYGEMHKKKMDEHKKNMEHLKLTAKLQKKANY